jgi:hypothetical protein
MTDAAKREARLFTASGRPAIAKAIGERQAREMRGKADPHGAKPAKDNAGTIAKAEALRGALERVEAELRRREAGSL